MDVLSYVASADSNVAVARIMYASQACFEGSVYGELDRIRASAVRHNAPQGVHTAILFQSGWFVQWKEGPASAIMATMERVARDPRHHSLRVVHASRGPRMLDGPWSMAVVQTDEPPDAMADRVAYLRHALHQGRQHSPPSIWRSLSTPAFHPGAQRQTEADVFQRVLVCSASGAGSFDLVRWLADTRRGEVVHRRYAGERDLDVGTSYVDFTQQGRLMRVVAMARRGLALPLTRAFLSDYSHLALVLSGDAERNEALMRRVAHACQSLSAPPPVVGISDLPEAHLAVQAQAQRLRLDYIAARGAPHSQAAAWAALSEPLSQWDPQDSGWDSFADPSAGQAQAAPSALAFAQ